MSPQGAAYCDESRGGILIASGPAVDIEQVRWVCNPWGRCWWRPNYYRAYGYYGGPRFYGPRPWGWRHHHHWRRW